MPANTLGYVRIVIFDALPVQQVGVNPLHKVSGTGHHQGNNAIPVIMYLPHFLAKDRMPEEAP